MTELITCQINPVAVFEDNEEEVAAGDIPHHEDLPQPGHVEPGVAAAPAAAAEAAAEVRDVAVPAEAAAAEDVPWDVLFPKKTVSGRRLLHMHCLICYLFSGTPKTG